MPIITRLTALEILDSRGRPTVRATCELASGAIGSASVPSGASTGAAEALELRDGDRSRYGGLGCRKAVANITGPIAEALTGRDWPAQEALDQALIALDGTPNKSHLGANAILAVSLAFARAMAAECRLPLYRYFASILGPDHQPATLPRPTINLFSGGKHAGGQVEIQDVGAVTGEQLFPQTVAHPAVRDPLPDVVVELPPTLCRQKGGWHRSVVQQTLRHAVHGSQVFLRAIRALYAEQRPGRGRRIAHSPDPVLKLPDAVEDRVLPARRPLCCPDSSPGAGLRRVRLPGSGLQVLRGIGELLESVRSDLPLLVPRQPHPRHLPQADQLADALEE